MRVLLSNPPWFPDGGARWGIRAGSRWPFTVSPGSSYYPYPFLLGYATSFLRSHRIDAYMVDSVLVRESLDSYYRRIREVGFDWVIIETATPSIDYDLAIAESITRLSPSTRVALAGAHPAVFAEDVLKKPFVHAVLKGEFEKNSLKLVTTRQPGVYDYDLVDDLSSSPYPYRDSTVYRYSDRFPNTPPGPQLQMWASRGCPFKCVFCLWPPTMYDNRTRYRDPDAVIREVEWAFANFPRFTSVYFDDDTFNVGNDRVQEIARGMKRLGIPWAAMCRADTSNLETFQMIAESGCYAVKFGIESGAQSLVDRCQKRLDLGKVRDSVKLLRSLGVWVHTTWTWGLPGETRDTIKATQRFFRDIRPSSAQESLCTPFPGTPYYDALSTSGSLVLEGWDQLDGARNTVIGSSDLSPSDLRGLAHLRVRVFIVARPEEITGDETRALAAAAAEAGYHPICIGANELQSGSISAGASALQGSNEGDILLALHPVAALSELPEEIGARKVLYLPDGIPGTADDFHNLSALYEKIVVGERAAAQAVAQRIKKTIVNMPDALLRGSVLDRVRWLLALVED